MQISASPDKDKDLLFKDSDSESFVFKHHVEMSSSYFPSVANKVMYWLFIFLAFIYFLYMDVVAMGDGEIFS